MLLTGRLSATSESIMKKAGWFIRVAAEASVSLQVRVAHRMGFPRNGCAFRFCVLPMLLIGWLYAIRKEVRAGSSCSPQAIGSASRCKARSAAPAPPQPTIEQQRARVLIQQAEAAYARGESDYRKGLLPEAKLEFDRAVDLLLSSGLDIKGNPQLQDEFDHIVDQVNALETEALKQGNGFVPQVEPTPSDVASDVTFQVDPNIVAKARADLATTKSDLPLDGQRLCGGLHQFLCQHAKGPQHAAAFVSALGPLPRNDSARHGRGRRSAGSYLSGSGRIGIPAPGHQSQIACGRHVAVYAVRQLRPAAQLHMSTSASIRKSRRAPMPAT